MAESVEEKAKNSGQVIRNCWNCNRELEIPREIHEKVREEREAIESGEHSSNSFFNRKYEGFYVSPNGKYYCNDPCSIMFI